MTERLPNDIRQRLERVNRSNGPYFADDAPAGFSGRIRTWTNS